MNRNIVVLGPPSDEPTEESIQIIIPPKPGQEDVYVAGVSTAIKTMDVCTVSITNIGQETDLPSSKLPFTLKLFEMLEHVAETGQEDIVSWVENGKAFKVHDLDRFVDNVIPIYFKQSKYKSFQRQLYFYSFTRQTNGSYFHPNFRRDRKSLCLSMAPKKNNCRSAKVASKSKARKPSTTYHPVHPTMETDLNILGVNGTFPTRPQEAKRRVSVEEESITPTESDDADWREKMASAIMRTATPPLLATDTSFSTLPPSQPSMIPRVSIVEHTEDTHNARSCWFDNLLGDSVSWYGNSFQQSSMNGQWEDMHAARDYQQFAFSAQEGDECCVFDDMTFHFVEHGV